MRWTNKLDQLRQEAILELGKVIIGYDVRSKWQESYEKDTSYRYEVPCEIYYNNFEYSNYSIVYFDGQSFLGYNWDDGEELWFDMDELSVNTICKLTDFING